MSIQDLFTRRKVLTSQNLEDTALDIETGDYLKTVYQDKNLIEPDIDFSVLDNFCKYASAERYYKDAFERIQRSYPFDGSGKEKLEWQLSGSLFDQYIFDNIYPKTKGYASFELETAPLAYSYIHVKGVMNTGSLTNLKDNFNLSNVYDPDKGRWINLRHNGSVGNTVEFWLSASTTPAGVTSSCIFEVSNSENSSIRVEHDGTQENFWVTYQSGSAGVFRETLVAPSPTNDWNHYAFSFQNIDADLNIEMYVNGELTDTHLEASQAVSEVTGSLSMNIGTFASSGHANGHFTGSLDEFRFWKRRRTHEEIGRFWFTNVNGGSNTDDAYVDLGVYFKFNEGITNTTRDRVFLDYSGRTSHGYQIKYSPTSPEIMRVTGSQVPQEDFDPIIYSEHPDVVAAKELYEGEGRIYDERNSTNLFNNIPQYLLEDDGDEGELGKLLQTMGAHYDSMAILVKDLPRLKAVKYSENKPYPFADRLLTGRGFIAPEIFEDADELAQIYARDEDRLFEEKLHNIKNNIYTNISNNLVEIYKTKGTEQSFRNLMRCYGVDENLIKINYYANNQIIKLKDSYLDTTTKRSYLNFDDADHYNAAIQLATSISYPTSLSAVPGLQYKPFSVEFDIILSEGVPGLQYRTDYSPISSSVGGVVTTSHDLRLNIVRDMAGSNSGYFLLTGSLIGELRTDLIENLYSNQRWVVTAGVALKEQYAGEIGSLTPTYNAFMKGSNAIVDQESFSFEVTGPVSETDGNAITTEDKEVYAGATLTPITPANVTTDIKLGAVRFYEAELDLDVIRLHCQDPNNIGVKTPLLANNLERDGYGQDDLKFSWRFDLVDLPDGSGNFVVLDETENDSLILGQGVGWPSGATVSEVVFIPSGKQNSADNISPRSFIEIRQLDDMVQTQNTNPIKYYISFEKSMFSVISDEMLRWFGTIHEFHNLIGAPKNRYSFDYHDLSKLRELFFTKVQNTPDVERFVEFYKWADHSLSEMIMELVPASASGARIRNVIENHIFARNKYQNKLPTIEYKYSDPETTVARFQRLSLAPLSNVQTSNCNWWKSRWEKKDTVSEDFFDALQRTHYQKLKNSVVIVTVNEQSYTNSSGNNSVLDVSIPLDSIFDKEEEC